MGYTRVRTRSKLGNRTVTTFKLTSFCCFGRGSVFFLGGSLGALGGPELRDLGDQK